MNYSILGPEVSNHVNVILSDWLDTKNYEHFTYIYVRVQCISVLITSSYVDYIHTKKYCVIFSLTFVFSVIK